MGEGLFEELQGNFEGVDARTPDGRRAGYNQNYDVQDGIKSATQRQPDTLVARPGGFRDVFGKDLALAAREGVTDQYRVLDGGVLLALDGFFYEVSSRQLIEP